MHDTLPNVEVLLEHRDWLRRLVENSRLEWFQLEERGEPFEVQESLFSAS